MFIYLLLVGITCYYDYVLRSINDHCYVIRSSIFIVPNWFVLRACVVCVCVWVLWVCVSLDFYRLLVCQIFHFRFAWIVRYRFRTQSGEINKMMSFRFSLYLCIFLPIRRLSSSLTDSFRIALVFICQRRFISSVDAWRDKSPKTLLSGPVFRPFEAISVALTVALIYLCR